MQRLVWLAAALPWAPRWLSRQDHSRWHSPADDPARETAKGMDSVVVGGAGQDDPR
jgi:hypothetical protein